MQNILIVVDMQNDFIDGAIGTKEAAAIVPKVEEKIRNFEGKVFFTRDTHETYYLETQEGKNLPVPHCIRGTDGWQIREELDATVEVGELIRTVDWDYPAFHLTLHCFWCELTCEALHLNEHEAAAWLTKDTLFSVRWLPADEGILKEIEATLE